MVGSTIGRRTGVWLAAASLLALAACNRTPQGTTNSGAAATAQPAALPMETGGTTSASTAPPVAALPQTAPVPVSAVSDPGDAYAYLDSADSFGNAIGDAPPDYAFDYDGVSPWAWQSDYGDSEYAEPVDGGYRYYYYRPGEDTPYLIRGPHYTYAYRGAALAAVFTAAGVLLSRDHYAARAEDAARFRNRADQLYHAAHNGQRHGVVAANWQARRPQIAADHADWNTTRQQQPAWSAYHQQHAAADHQHWQSEHQTRQAAAQRFAGWSQSGFKGPPPAPVRQPAVAGHHGQPEQQGQPDRHGQPDQHGQHGQQGQPGHPAGAPAAQPQPGSDQHAQAQHGPQAEHGRPEPAAHQVPAQHQPPAPHQQPAAHEQAPHHGAAPAPAAHRADRTRQAPTPEHGAPAAHPQAHAAPPAARHIASHPAPAQHSAPQHQPAQHAAPPHAAPPHAAPPHSAPAKAPPAAHGKAAPAHQPPRREENPHP